MKDSLKKTSKEINKILRKVVIDEEDSSLADINGYREKTGTSQKYSDKNSNLNNFYIDLSISESKVCIIGYAGKSSNSNRSNL